MTWLEVMTMHCKKHKNEAKELVASAHSDSASELTVESVNNHVYFYSGVSSDRCLALVKELRSIDETLRTERESRSIPADFQHTPIWLHVMSGGGDAFSALSISDQMRQIKTPIYSIVEGVAASAATIISMSCTRRYITPQSFMLIHQLSNMYWGTYEQFKDEMHIMDMLMGVAVDFYATHSKVSKKRIKKILKRDSWFGAAEALELGFVDEVMK